MLISLHVRFSIRAPFGIVFFALWNILQTCAAIGSFRLSASAESSSRTVEPAGLASSPPPEGLVSTLRCSGDPAERLPFDATGEARWLLFALPGAGNHSGSLRTSLRTFGLGSASTPSRGVELPP